MKVLLCLKEKNVDFVSHYVNLLLFEQHEPGFVSINPNGQVPVLVHDGRVVTESTVINEYLDDVFPETPLRPRDPYWRAVMRTWSKFVDDYFCPALSMIGWHLMVRKAAKAISEDRLAEVLARIPLKAQREKWATVAGDSFSDEQLAESRRRLGVSVQKMEKRLAESTWLAGDSYSLADINSFSMVAGVERLHPDFLNDKEAPASVNWLERMRQRPGVQAAMSMPNKVPETLRTFGG